MAVTGAGAVQGRAASGMTQRAWCRLRGVSLSSLNKAVAAGTVARLSDGRLSVVSADAWLAARSPRGRSGAPRKGSVAASQRKLTEYRARLARLDYLQRAGELVLAADVEKAAFDLGRRCRERLASMPGRIAPVLVGLATTAECYGVVEAEANLVADEFASGVLPWTEPRRNAEGGRKARARTP